MYEEDEHDWQDPIDPDTETPQLDVIENIDFDLNCINCGYNLRGASATGTCPECGEPVESALRPDLLHMASSDWLGKLSKGMKWVVTAIIMNIAMIPIAMVIAIAAVSTSPSTAGAMPMPAMVLLIVLGIGVSLVYGVGVWTVTEPESEFSQSDMPRLLARWLIFPAMLVGQLGDLFSMSGSPQAMLLGGIIDFASSIALLTGFLAALLYLKRLANRIPEPSLAKQTMTVFWGTVSVVSILILASLGMVLFAFSAASSSSPSGINTVMGVFGLLMCPLLIAMLVFFIWWVVLMFRYRLRFTQAYGISLSQG